MPIAVLLASPARSEPVPGDACSPSGIFTRSGGPELAGGGHFLVCDGTEWQSVLDYSATSGRVDVDIANDAGSCTAAKIGRHRYDDADDEWEYCDGTDPWKVLRAGDAASPDCTNDGTVLCTLDATRSNDDPQFTAANIKNGVDILGVTGSYTSDGGGCTPDPTCPNVGDVCSGDGSGGGNPKFAGCVCYYDANSADDGTCTPLYVAQSDQSTTSQWKTSNGMDDITTDSAQDGKINDSQVPTSNTFPAFKLCKDLTDGGYPDWYLPARTELDLLWRHKDVITNFSTTTYHTSSERDANGAWYQNFGSAGSPSSSGIQSSTSKQIATHVRCVRRD